MRVLVVTHIRAWPLDCGGAKRTFAIVTALARRHAVTLVLAEPLDPSRRGATEHAYRDLVSRIIWVALDHATAPPPGRPGGVRRAARNVTDFLTHWLPAEFRAVSRPWHGALRASHGQFDAILCRQATLAPALLDQDHRRVVVDFDDLQHRVRWRTRADQPRRLHRLRDGVEAVRTWWAEQIIARRSAQVLVCSREDAGRLLCRNKTVVPNGVDLEPGPRAPRENDTLVFVGNWRYRPNSHGLEWFVAEVWPRVRAARPTARLRVVGLDATPERLPFAVAEGIELIPDVPSVKPWFESATASIAPIHIAGGTRVKILESLGYGTPVVATRIGAEGLTEAFDESLGLAVAANAADMAERLCALLANPAPALAAAERGAGRIAERYTWDKVMGPLAEYLEGWVRAATRPAP